jgi:hypothetical protein
MARLSIKMTKSSIQTVIPGISRFDFHMKQQLDRHSFYNQENGWYQARILRTRRLMLPQSGLKIRITTMGQRPIGIRECNLCRHDTQTVCRGRNCSRTIRIIFTRALLESPSVLVLTGDRLFSQHIKTFETQKA